MEEYKYRAIVEWVKQYISDNKLRPNDRFLTEKELCEIHGVSRQTVRQALMKLERDNILLRVRGSGTFVKSAPVSDADTAPAKDAGSIPSALSASESNGTITPAGIAGTGGGNGGGNGSGNGGFSISGGSISGGSFSGSSFSGGSFSGIGIGNGTIGVVSTYFSDYIFPHIITGIVNVLNDAGLKMQLASTNNQVSEETSALGGMIESGVAGLIVEPSKSALPNPNTDLYRRIRDKRIPLVFFNAKYPWADFPCVSMDDEAAGRIVTDYLFDCGHTDICGLFALDDIQGHKRYSGFMNSCLAHGKHDAEKNVLWYVAAEKGELFDYAAKRLSDMIAGCTAIVCYNDMLAVRLLSFCRSIGVSVPDDLSIVGIDDSNYARICDVPLTTARHPHKELGEAAAKALLDLMNGRQSIPDVIFAPELVIRSSVRTIDGKNAARRESGAGSPSFKKISTDNGVN